MVNLNANRNLTPDATPWGKAIEKRLADLERNYSLLDTALRSQGVNINILTTRLNALTRNSLIEDVPATYSIVPASPSAAISGEVPIIYRTVPGVGTYEYAQYGGVLLFGAPNQRALSVLNMSVTIHSQQNTSGVVSPYVVAVVFIKDPTTGNWVESGGAVARSLKDVPFSGGYNLLLNGSGTLELPSDSTYERLEACVGLSHGAFTAPTDVTISNMTFEIITA